MKKFLMSFVSIVLLIGVLSLYSAADTYIDTEDPTGGDSGSTPVGGVIAAPEIDAKASLVMEASTGAVLYEDNSEEALPPASVTKIMTLLLVMEALANHSVTLQDMVTVSAYAASMGGSQVFLAEGEQLTLEDLLKCTVIASANDAAVALAEYLMGSEEAFVTAMNERAKELGANTAHFENVTGLDDDTQNHVMSAMDIALISRELISHKQILTYSSVWMDSIRGGEFTLTNTNRLIRFYDGATGLKTGSTDKAKFCISATADKNGMELIVVIMGAPSRDSRNMSAKTLFDWAYANYGLYTDPATGGEDVHVLCGKEDSVGSQTQSFAIVLPKGSLSSVERSVSYTESISAPVLPGDTLGTVTYTVGGEVVGTVPIFATESVEKLNLWGVFVRMVKIYILS